MCCAYCKVDSGGCVKRAIVLVGLILASVPGVQAQVAVSPQFDAVVIKPARADETGRDWDRDNNMTQIGNYPLADLILRAYNLKSASQLVDIPDWAGKERYDITAKMTAEELKQMEALSPRDSREFYLAALRSMLAERFGLRVEKATRKLPRFALERVSETNVGPGLHVTPTGPDGRAVGGRNSSRHTGATKATFTASGVDMTDLADSLSGLNEVGQRVVVDKTGLTGFYNFKLEYAPDSGMGVSSDANLPGLLDAVRQELGLKLVKDEGDVPVVIVKEAKKPELD